MQYGEDKTGSLVWKPQWNSVYCALVLLCPITVSHRPRCVGKLNELSLIKCAICSCAPKTAYALGNSCLWEWDTTPLAYRGFSSFDVHLVLTGFGGGKKTTALWCWMSPEPLQLCWELITCWEGLTSEICFRWHSCITRLKKQWK